MQREFLIPACSIVFILPLCFSLRIDFLKYASSVGVLSVIYVVVLVAYEYFEGGYIPGPIKTKPDKWTDVFLVVPVICFGYQVIKYYLSVYLFLIFPVFFLFENFCIMFFSIYSAMFRLCRFTHA